MDKLKPGNTPGNAKPSTIHFQVDRVDKARWVASANREGMKLADWIKAKCNPAARFDNDADPTS